jgi:hypothetical protein
MAGYRQRMRAAGLRPLQIWVPDTRAPEFVETCCRQAAIVGEADREDSDLRGFLDAAFDDLDWSAP